VFLINKKQIASSGIMSKVPKKYVFHGDRIMVGIYDVLPTPLGIQM
jgi:hypothetical protein